MNAENDNPFTRWSRRKLASRGAEAPPSDETEDVNETADKEDVRHEASQSTPAEPDAAEPQEALPRLDDLSAESDLTPFLREGVPSTLKNTALRKMWSLDPAIRDYVGPAEYAWDFNDPGSMAGFGPLRAGKSVVDFLSKVDRSDLQEKAEKPQAVPQQEAVAPSDEEPAALSDEPPAISGAAEPALPDAPPENPYPASTPNDIADAGGPGDRATPAKAPRKSARSRHGGALPR